MKSFLENYSKKRGWKALTPLLPCCILPLALLGFTAKPVLEFNEMRGDLDQARARRVRAQQLRTFLAGFGDEGPPTAQYRQMESLLIERMPTGFETTAFYEATLQAVRGLDIDLQAIVPNGSSGLDLPVGDYTIHEYTVTLKGRAHAEYLTAFLVAMHRVGHPVCVHRCHLHALGGKPGVFDFHLDLGVFYLVPPENDDTNDGSNGS